MCFLFLQVLQTLIRFLGGKHQRIFLLLPSVVSFSRYVQCYLCGEAPSDRWCEVKEGEKRTTSPLKDTLEGKRSILSVDGCKK